MKVFYNNIFTKLLNIRCHCDSDSNYNENQFNPKINQYSNWNYNWDNRKDEKSTVIRQIVLIRHGQFIQNKHTDQSRVLTELGRKQALLTGKRLQELIDGNIIYPIRSIHYSTMARATETYQCILPALNISRLKPYQHQPCSMIREGAVYKPNPQSISWEVKEEDFVKDSIRVEAAFKNYIQRSIDDEEENLIDSDESSSKQEHNNQIKNSNHSKIFICHGNVIRYFVMRSLQLPPEAWLRTAVYNSSITILNIYPSGRVSLYCMGDVGFLPVNMITYK